MSDVSCSNASSVISLTVLVVITSAVFSSFLKCFARFVTTGSSLLIVALELLALLWSFTFVDFMEWPIILDHLSLPQCHRLPWWQKCIRSLLKLLISFVINLVSMVGNQVAFYPCVIGWIQKPCISNPVQNNLILHCFQMLGKKHTPLCNSTLNHEIVENV